MSGDTKVRLGGPLKKSRADPVLNSAYLMDTRQSKAREAPCDKVLTHDSILRLGSPISAGQAPRT